MARIPVDLIAENLANGVLFMNPPAVSITRNSDSLKLDTGFTDVILSPGGIGNICISRHHIQVHMPMEMCF